MDFYALLQKIIDSGSLDPYPQPLADEINVSKLGPHAGALKNPEHPGDPGVTQGLQNLSWVIGDEVLYKWITVPQPLVRAHEQSFFDLLNATLVDFPSWLDEFLTKDFFFLEDFPELFESITKKPRRLDVRAFKNEAPRSSQSDPNEHTKAEGLWSKDCCLPLAILAYGVALRCYGEGLYNALQENKNHLNLPDTLSMERLEEAINKVHIRGLSPNINTIFDNLLPAFALSLEKIEEERKEDAYSYQELVDITTRDGEAPLYQQIIQGGFSIIKERSIFTSKRPRQNPTLEEENQYFSEETKPYYSTEVAGHCPFASIFRGHANLTPGESGELETSARRGQGDLFVHIYECVEKQLDRLREEYRKSIDEPLDATDYRHPSLYELQEIMEYASERSVARLEDLPVPGDTGIVGTVRTQGKKPPEAEI